MESKIRVGRQATHPPLNLLCRTTVSKRKIDINTATKKEIGEALSLSSPLVNKIISARKKGPVRNWADFEMIIGKGAKKLEISMDRLVFLFRDDVQILDCNIQGGRIFSYKPFAFEIGFRPPTNGKVCFSSVTIQWRGQPFTVQQEITTDENKAGRALLKFSKDFSLPPGLINIHITLYDINGGADSYNIETWVYPSNPFSLFLSPLNRSIYNGSIRPDWDGTNWITGMNVTFLNGDNVEVRLTRNVTFEFWDGGVGGTLVERGNFNWSEEIRVAPFGTYNGWATVTSPPGGDIFNKYEGKEDMTIQMIFNKSDGSEVKALITCRIMAGFGINIIHVGDYTDRERITIDNGVNDARDVYENHGLTFSSVQSWEISNAQAGGYTTLSDDDEFDDLVDDWTVPNDSVDCFVVNSLWDSVAGNSPMPGPDEKDGSCDSDGLAIDKSMQCLAHELGHYMGGLEHADAEGLGNVMHRICGGRNFTYGQYKSFFGHGWTRIVR